MAPPTESQPQQSTLATVLIGLLIIASGLLLYNYFQTATSPKTVVVNQDDQKSGDASVPGGTIAPNDDKKTTDGGSYTVVAGDTLWSIAEKIYGDGHRWSELYQANDIQRNSLGQPLVEVGQVLKAPGSAATIDAGNVVDNGSKVDQTPTDTTKVQTYTVVRGDTLWSIAERHYGDGSWWPVIFNYQANRLGRLANGTPLIHAGNVLTLPAVLPGN